LDAVFITDTYDHSLTDPETQRAIEKSSIIHIVKTASYLAAILRAQHMEVTNETADDENSVSALLRGTHPDQTGDGKRLAEMTPLKAGNPLLKMAV
jgi:hypothetical protein